MRRLLRCVLLLQMTTLSVSLAHAEVQLPIDRVELMPNRPAPYQMRDWKAVARAYDALAFNFQARGEHLPLVWWDDSRVNIPTRTFGLPSYVGARHVGGGHHEAITCLAALLGATVAGIDKSSGEHDFVAMAPAYYNSRNGQDLVLNGISTGSGGSYWYDLYPHYLFYGLVDRYPKEERLEAIMRATADRWYDACVALGGPSGSISFEHTGFDFRSMRSVYNGRWKEPDAAGAIAWLEYMAYVKFHDPKYLDAADWCLRWLEQHAENPHYEALMPMGALVAARMNAEQGRHYDVRKMTNWCFDPSRNRPGWGVIAERWGNFDCHGLVGSTTDGGGYAFAMNTFEHLALLVPLARYDDRFARAIGKWALNAANAARLFYPNALPADQQTCPDWKGDPSSVIAYEGLRKEGLEYARRTPRLKDQRANGQLAPERAELWERRQPFALGDPSQYGWDATTDFGLYGSSCVGFLGGIVATTNVDMVLRLDLLATDSFHGSARPSYLFYNPHDHACVVVFKVGGQSVDLYDAVRNSDVASQVTGTVSVEVPADSAVLLVVVPAGTLRARDGHRTLVGGVVIDFRDD